MKRAEKKREVWKEVQDNNQAGKRRQCEITEQDEATRNGGPWLAPRFPARFESWQVLDQGG